MEYKKLKRNLDIVFSSSLIVLTSPLLITLGLLVKIDSEGKIIYSQKRTGINGKKFNIYKFRTMEKNNDYLKEDKVTKVGKIIRKTGLDELPQLFNILKGDMSFIGPRPWDTSFYKYYTDEQKRRLSVKPGLISPSVFHPKTNILDLIQYDIDYIDNYSFKNDIKLLSSFIVKYPKIYSKREEDSNGNKKFINESINSLKYNKIDNNGNIKDITNTPTIYPKKSLKLVLKK